MFKFTKYIIKREYKVFILSMLVLIVYSGLMTFNVLPENIIGKGNSVAIAVLISFAIFIFMTDRLNWYIEKGMINDSRDHFMLIPQTPGTIIGSVFIVAAIEIIVFDMVTAMLGGFDFAEFLMLFSYVFCTFTGVTMLGTYLLLIISRFVKRKINGYASLVLIILVAAPLIVRLSVNTDFRIPYLYSYGIAYISTCVFITGIGFFGLCKGNTFNHKETKYRWISLLVVVLAFTVYGVGQLYTYYNL